MITPLEPKEFFRGIWRGNGELCPHPLLRWALRQEHIDYLGKVVGLAETTWMVEEQFEFSSGNKIARKMFVEMVTPNRLHVTADDMPGGADVLLHEKGFRFTPYYIWTHYRGRKCRLKCIDENRIDENGAVCDTIKIYFFSLHVCTIQLTVTIDRQ